MYQGGGMADAKDLKSFTLWVCGFDSHPWYQLSGEISMAKEQLKLQVLRLCLWCINFEGDIITSGGCTTCGYGGTEGVGYSCREGLFADTAPNDGISLAVVLSTAEECPKYEAVASVKLIQKESSDE